MKNLDSNSHVRGESVYLDDIPLVESTLHAAVFDSPVAAGTIRSLNTARAEAIPGVAEIIVASDLKGENQIGGIIPDEPLLADGEVHFQGMPKRRPMRPHGRLRSKLTSTTQSRIRVRHSRRIRSSVSRNSSDWEMSRKPSRIVRTYSREERTQTARSTSTSKRRVLMLFRLKTEISGFSLRHRDRLPFSVVFPALRGYR